jgi:hypothetical protein
VERRARTKTGLDENPSNAPGGPLAALFTMAPETLCRARLGFCDLGTVPNSSQRCEFGEPRPVGFRHFRWKSSMFSMVSAASGAEGPFDCDVDCSCSLFHSDLLSMQSIFCEYRPRSNDLHPTEAGVRNGMEPAHFGISLAKIARRLGFGG